MSAPPYTAEWLSGPMGFRFYTRTYHSESPIAVVIFVHGFADHISRYADFHSKFPPRGVTVFAYDLRGFGRTALDAARRSPGAAYDKTDTRHEIQDLEWWIHHVAKTHAGLPIYLLGYSMGGGTVLYFATKEAPLQRRETIDMITGIITHAPLLRLTFPPPPKLIDFATLLAKVFPNLIFPAHEPEERFTRDHAAVKDLKDDPLRKSYGRVRGLVDMLNRGLVALRDGPEEWPRDLGLLLSCGTADKVNDIDDAFAFFARIPTENKALVRMERALHDVFHETYDVPERLAREYISWIKSTIAKTSSA
ncbi:lysophospholipase [Daedaleopsis nitida]|nr:lysophospholipase [Daedaleopsis nitida]